MADNIVFQSGTLASPANTEVVATDEIGGVDYQKVKLTDGTSDSATMIAAGGGVEAGALRVTLASDSTGVVSVDDNGGSLTVDGTFFQATQPVSVASVVSVSDNGGSLTVDGSVSVSGNVEIVNDVGNAIPVAGTFFQATQPVSVAAAVPINDNGGSLTVDGTFFQATQPVSGTFFQATQPVSGTFFQATQPVSLAGTTSVTQQPSAAAGGLTTNHLVSAANTNPTSIKTSAGRVYSITAFNLNASPRYLKFHNTVAAPTAGTGVVRTVLIPGSATGAGVVISDVNGFAFTTGIAFTLVTGIADTDANSVGANEIVLDIGWT